MSVIHKDMPRKPSENTSQVALRLPEAWLDRCDALAPALSIPGITATRTDVLRAAIARGLDELEADASGGGTKARDRRHRS
jgi:hypothetical protein